MRPKRTINPRRRKKMGPNKFLGANVLASEFDIGIGGLGKKGSSTQTSITNKSSLSRPLLGVSRFLSLLHFSAKDVVAMAIALFVDSQFRFKEGSVFISGKFDVIKGRGECNLHPRVWSSSADNRITVSCDAAIKSHPMDMAATAFVARDKRCIPLFAGVCWDISSREKFLNWRESA